MCTLRDKCGKFELSRRAAPTNRKLSCAVELASLQLSNFAFGKLQYRANARYSCGGQERLATSFYRGNILRTNTKTRRKCLLRDSPALTKSPQRQTERSRHFLSSNEHS